MLHTSFLSSFHLISLRFIFLLSNILLYCSCSLDFLISNFFCNFSSTRSFLFSPILHFSRLFLLPFHLHRKFLNYLLIFNKCLPIIFHSVFDLLNFCPNHSLVPSYFLHDIWEFVKLLYLHSQHMDVITHITFIYCEVMIYPKI